MTDHHPFISLSMACGIALSVLAVLSPFYFPWGFSVVISLAAGVFFPPIVLVPGVLLDVLYFGSHESGFPYFTILASIAAVALSFVQQFVKARIMS